MAFRLSIAGNPPQGDNVLNELPPREISADEVEAYARDGVVCLRRMFDADWVAFMRDAAEQCMAAPGEQAIEFADTQDDPGRFFHDTYMWTRNDACRRFVFDSPAAKIARALMGSAKVDIFFDQWLIKEPGTPTRTPWHHDLPYWPVDGDQICTVWLALDPVTAATGAVEYVKGSHRWGQRYQAQSFAGDARYQEPLPKVPDIDATRGELEIAQFEVEPGDCILHHGLSVHGAPGNASTGQRRRAFVTRWAGDDAVYHPRPDIMPMLAEPDLAPGDPITCDVWPRVWPPAEA